DACLNKAPSARPQTADAVLSELNHVFETKIDTGKLFSSRAPKVPGKRIAILMIVLLSIFLGSAILVPVLQKKEDNTGVKTVELSNNLAKQLRQLELSVQSRKRAFYSRQSDEDKTEYAKRYM